MNKSDLENLKKLITNQTNLISAIGEGRINTLPKAVGVVKSCLLSCNHICRILLREFDIEDYNETYNINDNEDNSSLNALKDIFKMK